ncbi:MAG: hypothetical protein KGS61_08770 [Verrucomicrobia bacterium]|nr:hypothetical protein [Verrucomicrobiota bacterium]
MKADRSVWLGLGVIAVAIVVAFEATRRPSQRLADGTLLVLDKVEVGQVFTDAHGTLLENLFDPLIWQSILAEPLSPRSIPEGKVNVTVAIEPVLRLDFTARPRLVP